MLAVGARSGLMEARGVLRVLVVGSSVEEARTLRDLFAGDTGFRLQSARSLDDARTLLLDGAFDAALVDHAAWVEDGGLLSGVPDQRPNVAIVLIVGGESDQPLPSPKLGAHDFVSRRRLDRDEIAARLMAAVELNRTARRRDTMVRWLEREARTDHLTGLYNRRAFDERLRDACTQSQQSRGPVGLIAIDVSGTRIVNEAHGHDAGDAMIRRAAAGVTRSIRAADFAARTGGDEFAIILPGADIDLCRRVARRIAHELERLNADEWSADIPVSVTFGVASATACDPADLFAAADAQVAASRLPRRVLTPFPFREDSDGPSVA